MPEYRGIVNPAEVKATPTFDWNTVIGDVQKSLVASEASRQANRDKLEKDTNDTITAIGKVTLGKDEALNKKLTDAAYNFKDLVGKNAQLVREGKMPQKDFNIFNQNLSDTFNTIDAVGKNAKSAYDSYISESKAGNLSAASDYLAQTLGLAASLTNKNIIADPKTGRGFIVGQDPNDLVEVNWLNNQKNLLVPKVKLDVLMDANTDKIGKYALIGGVTKSGILSTDDPRERKGYEDYRKTVANGIISNPMGALSILTDYGDIDGVRYTPTINKAEADADKTGTKVYMKLNSTGNPEPVFTPKQLEAAGKIIENEVDQRVNVITTQVQNKEATWRGWAPDRSGGDGKPVEKIASISDVIYSSPLKLGNKFIPIQRFNMSIPVKDESTGTIKTIKSIDIDPLSRNMDMTIETSSTVEGKKQTSLSTVSTKKGGLVKYEISEGKLGSPVLDIAEINNMVRHIQNPNTGEYLRSWSELYDAKQPETLKNWRNIQKGGGAQTTANTQSDFNSKWSKLKKGQSLVGPDGNTYTKK